MPAHRRIPGPARTMADRREREVQDQERRLGVNRDGSRRGDNGNRRDEPPPIEWGALEAKYGKLSTTKPGVPRV